MIPGQGMVTSLLAGPMLSKPIDVDVVVALCKTEINKTRQGYTRKRILKLAGSSFLGQFW